MISLDAFLKFSEFWFWFVRGLGEGVKRQKMAQNGKKNVLLRISGTVPHMIVVFGTHE